MKIVKANLILVLLAMLLSTSEAYSAQYNKDVDVREVIERKSSKKSEKVEKVVIKKSTSKIVYTKAASPSIKTVRTIPQTAKVVKRSGVSYHFHNGNFYRFINGRYIVSVPPKGVKVVSLPAAARRIMLGGIYYHYLNGVYYQESKNGEYEVVEAPQDIIVDYLPEEAEEVYIDDKRYFAYENTLYTVITTADGKKFKVAAQLED